MIRGFKMIAVLKVIKVNILSLLAFPLFVVALAAKLVRQALEKFLVFVGVGAAVIGLVILKALIQDPGKFFQNIFFLLIISLFTIFSIVFVLIYLVGSLAAAITKTIIAALMAVFEYIFMCLYKGWSYLYDVCESDYDNLKDKSTTKLPALACVGWHLLRFVNFITIKLLTRAVPLSIAASAGFVVYAILFTYDEMDRVYGMSPFEYLKSIPQIDAVFAVLYFAVTVLGIIAILISLGMEWKELGEEMGMNFSGTIPASLARKSDRAIPAEAFLKQSEDSFEEGKSTQRCQHYLDTLVELIDGLGDLNRQVDAAMSISRDPVMEQKFHEYINLINILTEQMSAYESGIDAEVFKRVFIPQIEKAIQLSREINKETLRIISQNASSAVGDNNHSFDFFSGCLTEEDIKRRYKALCRAYHPDVGGHEETFKILQNQYENKLNAI